MTTDLGHLRVPESDLVTTVSGADNETDVVRIDLRLAAGEVKGILGSLDHIGAGINQRARDDAGAFFHHDGFCLRRTDVNSGCESHGR